MLTMNVTKLVAKYKSISKKEKQVVLVLLSKNKEPPAIFIVSNNGFCQPSSSMT